MKQRFAAKGVLVVVALWPLVTLVLQRTFDVDPWKLMSFGMYAVPSRNVALMTLEAAVERQGAWVPVTVDRDDPRIEKLLTEVATLGALAKPRPLLVELAFAHHADSARLVIHLPGLRRSSARVYRKRASFTLLRDGALVHESE